MRAQVHSEAGDADVEDFDVAVVAHHDVFGLDVAVDDSGLVCYRERARGLCADSRDRSDGD
jgi:hypothetical protein